MEKIIMTSVSVNSLIESIAHRTAQIIESRKPQPQPSADDPLSDLIPKSEVRGKLASASTLWKYEKEGRIKSYAISGKRFYKRSELMDALTELKK